MLKDLLQRFSVQFVLACFVLSWLSGNLLAQDDSPPYIFGTVETSENEPAANVKVWLVGLIDVDDFERGFGILSKTVCNSEGEYAFDLDNEEELFKAAGSLTVWASSGSGDLGWHQGFYQFKKKPLKIRLKPTKALSGRLVDGAEKPIANAKVVPTMLAGLPFNQLNRSLGMIPEESKAKFASTTDAEGRFKLTGIPATGSVWCDVESAELPKTTVIMNASESVTAKLDVGLALIGKIDPPADANLPAADELGELIFYGTALYDSAGNLVKDKALASLRVQTQYKTKIDQSGEFHLDNISPGAYRISGVLTKGVPLLLPKEIKLDVKPGEPINDFKINALKAFKITGRVIGSVDGDPIAGARVSVTTLIDGYSNHRSGVKTDAEGKYTAFAHPGTVSVRVVDAPSDYARADDLYGSEYGKKRNPRLEVSKDMVWPDLLVDPAQDLTIEVFDENGKPAANAAVKIVALSGYPDGEDYQTVQKTDSNGRYVARQVASNDTLPIRVYTPTAISDASLIITPSEHDKPVRIDLSPDHGVRLRCRVVDRAGDPIVNASVGISTSYPYVSKWADNGLAISGSVGGGETDAEGNFVSGPVWPDLRYSLIVRAEGYARTESPVRAIKGNEAAKIQPIVLAETKVASIFGVVVDANKNPLKGVNIYAAGKPNQVAKTQTNSKGEFKLDELASDVRYVFADSKGFRFAGARVSDKSIEISLRKLDEAPKGIRPRRELDQDVQFETAKGLLELAWSLPTNRRNLRTSMLKAMEKIDEDKAMKMSIQSGIVFTDALRETKAERLYESDPEQAIQLLRLTQRRIAISRSIEFAKRLAKSNSNDEKSSAKKFLEFARELIKKDWKYFPKLAAVHTLLGEHDEAKKLNTEVISKLDENPAAAIQQSLAKDLAISLAPYDYEKAQAYAKLTGSVASQTYALSDVALAILSTDRQKSLAEIEKLGGNANARNIRDRARYRAAYLLVAEEPDLAVKLIYQCEASDNRAQALGRLAVEIGKTDQAKAWKMIDDALVIYRGNPDVASSWSNYGGAGPFVAAIAYQAKSIGYPDMESVVWQVVAACRANGEIDQQRIAATIDTARLLALVDKLAARDLLNSIAITSDQALQTAMVNHSTNVGSRLGCS